MEKEKVEFMLDKVLKYSAKGDFNETGSITMYPPSMDCFEEASDLSQVVMTAFMDARKYATEDAVQEQKKKEEDIDADAIKMILFSSTQVKFTHVSKRFNELANKVCEIETGVFLNQDIVSKMDIKDYVRLVCEYISNFILPSLLSAGEGSEESRTGSKS